MRSSNGILDNESSHSTRSGCPSGLRWGNDSSQVINSGESFGIVLAQISFFLKKILKAPSRTCRVGCPFSQSSSTMNINGQKESRMQASFEVKGVNGGGIL